MRVKARATVALLLCAVLVAACGSKSPNLIRPKTGQGPDEFGIIPNKPLQMPDSLSALPAPTPGGANLADPTPEADAVAALGGSPKALTRGGIDGGIVTYASRYGVQPDIRQSLAQDDLAFRQRHPGRVLERLFGITTYYRIYEPYELDQYAELARLRRSGIRTPSAPPETR